MKKLILFVKYHFLGFDLFGSILATIFGLVLAKEFGVDIIPYLLQHVSEINSLLINASLSLFGFLITGISILIVFLSDNRLSRLQATSHPKTIMMIYFSAIRWMAVLAIVAIVGMSPVCLHVAYSYILITLTVINIARVARCVWIIEKLAAILYSNS